MAEQCIESTRWGVAQTKPREEELAVANLRRQGFEVFLPLLKERHKTEQRVVPMFPGYVFVAIGELWQPIASTRGVKRIITTKPDRPAFLPRGWVESLREQGTLDLFTDALAFKKGDQVEFIAGPFEGRTATCKWTSEARVGLLFDFLGRETVVQCEAKILKRLQ
jgi:transcriptional antiterminator RfaH